MVGCGQTSATWLPSTMRLPPSTRPSGSRERRSSAFIREDSGIAQRPRRILSIASRMVLEQVGGAIPPGPSKLSELTGRSALLYRVCRRSGHVWAPDHLSADAFGGHDLWAENRGNLKFRAIFGLK